MEIKKIVVCGDSFCSAGIHSETHFSQLLSNKYGYDVINIARGGISNTAICYQIKQAINMNPDLIIFRVTGSSRLDIPIKKFNKHIGLRNFLYPWSYEHSHTSPHTGGVTGTVLSDTIEGFFVESRQQSLPENLKISISVKEAIKQYITYMYDDDLQTERDKWMIGYWLSQLEKKNIPYIEICENGIGKEIYIYIKNNPDKIMQTVYHTDRVTQEIVADSIDQKIKNWK
jgi:hypothetical protein